MIILKSFGYSIVGLLTFIFLFFFFHLIIALGDIIHDKLTKIVKKNKYVDKTVAIAVNLLNYRKGVVKYSNLYNQRDNKRL